MVKRRANNEGSLTYRKSRKCWEGRYLVYDDRGVKHYKTISAKTKSEAAEKLRQGIVAAKNKQFNFRKSDTLENYTQYWCELMSKRYEMHPDDPDNYKPHTIETYMYAIQRVLFPVLGRKPISKIDKKDIRLALQGFNDNTGHTRTCQISRNAISAVMKLAIEEEIISENPAIGVIVPKYKRLEKEIWTTDELKCFLAAAKKTNLYPMYLLLVSCGLRRGEVLGLRKCDCDLNNGVIRVRQQVISLNNKPVIATLKTESSCRDIPIAEDINNVLRKWIEEDTTDNELMFHTSNNTPIAPRNFARAYKKLVQEAGIRYLSPHSLRHSFCTDMCMSGVNQKTNQVLMGHSDPTITQKVYEHATKASMIDAIRRVGELRGLELGFSN